jgi:O-antigen/teichoic acid export membrane protein
MLEHLKHLSAQTLIFGLGGAVTRLAGLLLLPLYTHILTPADYGKIAIVNLVITVVNIILTSGQSTAFFRFYFQNEDYNIKRKLIGTVFLYLVVSAAVILFPVILGLGFAVGAWFKETDLLPLIRIALLGAFFEVGSVIPFAIFRAEQRGAQYASLSFMRFLLNIILNIIAVAVLHWGVWGVIYANVLTAALFFIVCLGLIWHSIIWRIDASLLKQLLGFGLPLVPAGLASWALTFSDRFFLERYAGLSQVGIYAVGYSIAGIVNVIMGWFNTAWGPYYFSVAQQAEAKEIYARVLTYALALFTLIGLGLSLFAKEILLLFAPPVYAQAAAIVPLIVLAYLFFEMNYLSVGLDLTGKTGYYPFIIGSAAIVNLGLNFLLIPRWGMMGAAWATVLSYLLLPLMIYPLAQRLFPCLMNGAGC